jgi:gas vesicle protein
MTHTETQGTRGRDFLIGAVAGGIMGTAIAFYLAPRLTAELRMQITDSAQRLRRTAADHLEQVSTRIGDAIDQVASAGHAVQGDAGQDGVKRVRTPDAAL